MSFCGVISYVTTSFEMKCCRFDKIQLTAVKLPTEVYVTKTIRSERKCIYVNCWAFQLL